MLTVIFDCDGVLVDSEIVASRVLAKLLCEIGLPLSPRECIERYTGISNPEMFRMIEAELGRLLPEDIDTTLSARDAEAFRRELQPVKGIAEALARIDAPMGVASSGNLEKIHNSLTITGLIGWFSPHIYSARQVKKSKPAPDVFLFAASSMGVAPSSCVVVEDSVAGVRAGCAAGMRVLGFTGAGHCVPEDGGRLKAAGADTVFADMSELPGLLI